MCDARSLVLVLALVPLATQEHEASGVRVADDLYPAAKVEEVVRFVAVKTDEPELGDLKDALDGLGAQVVYGPRTSEGNSGRSFFAVRLPWQVSGRELERAMRKAGGVADELAVTAFEGREGRDTAIEVGPFGFTSRDFVMGISGDIEWFDSVGGWSQFYGRPKKIEADEIAKRYEKLYAPYGGGTLGRVVEERFTWTLAAAPDEKVAKKLLKAVQKLDGVVGATLEGAALGVHVRLEDVVVAQVAGTLSASTGEDDAFDATGLAAPRAAWCTRPLWDLLDEQGLAPAP